MRHLFQAAIVAEEKGKAFYERLAEKVVQPEVRELCRKLAAEEAGHKKFIAGILSQWPPLPPARESLKQVSVEMEGSGILKDPPAANCTEEEMVRYAVQQERKMAAFYLFFEDTFPELWKKMHIHDLVVAERSHERALTNAFPQYDTV